MDVCLSHYPNNPHQIIECCHCSGGDEEGTEERDGPFQINCPNSEKQTSVPAGRQGKQSIWMHSRPPGCHLLDIRMKQAPLQAGGCAFRSNAMTSFWSHVWIGWIWRAWWIAFIDRHEVWMKNHIDGNCQQRPQIAPRLSGNLGNKDASYLIFKFVFGNKIPVVWAQSWHGGKSAQDQHRQ